MISAGTEWLPVERQLRVVLGGRDVARTTRPRLLRQHGFLPVYYVPREDVAPGALVACGHATESPYKGRASYFDVVSGGRTARAAGWTYAAPRSGSPDTRGYVSFDWHSMDAFYEEDERLYVHARDPFLRVDALRSARRVEIAVGDMIVADSRRPVLVQETGLVNRWYLPPADVDGERLRASDTATLCPYKGRAQYASVELDGRLHADVAWTYREPRGGLDAVRDHLCFYAERPDVTTRVDGRELPDPGTRPSGDGGELLTPNRLFFIVPPPAAMRGTQGLQLAAARPNRRAEGPPDGILDVAANRMGGRPGDWLPPPPRWPQPAPGLTRVANAEGAVYTAAHR
jgi:uncharacterized protein (DUF427 family)